MAATGKTPILLYGSTTPTNAPAAGNLTNSSDGCEIAINVADKNLFFKDSTNAINTVPIRQSSASSNGWLSSTDWSTFNSKQPAGTYVTSVTGTAPVVSSGGTTPAISMAAANGSTNGYLTSTDWSTFNGKQAALVSGTNIKTVSGTTLLGSGDLGTIGTGYGGTGLTSFTAKGVVYASSTSALTTGTALQFDGSNLGINVTPNAWASFYRAIDVSTYASFFGASTNNAGIMNNAYFNGSNFIYRNTAAATYYSQSGGTYTWSTAASGTAGDTISFTSRMELTSTQGDLTLKTGNLVIGTSGKGIDFSATAGTGTSELLADYEEGTWTPTYALTTPGTSSFTYNIQSAYYTKVGNLVYARCAIRSNSFTQGTGSGTVRIAGLPYAAKASSNFAGATVNYTSSFAGDMPSSGTCYQGTSYVDLYYRTTSNGGTISLDVTDLGTGASANYTILTIEYLTD